MANQVTPISRSTVAIVLMAICVFGGVLMGTVTIIGLLVWRSVLIHAEPEGPLWVDDWEDDWVPVPAPRYEIRDIEVDDSCATFFDFCIEVTCLISNIGDAAGMTNVYLELHGGPAVLQSSEFVELGPGNSWVVRHRFPEARLSYDYTGHCRMGETY